jgi:hypothetical protein
VHLLERRSSLEVLEQCARDLRAGEGRIALSAARQGSARPRSSSISHRLTVGEGVSSGGAAIHFIHQPRSPLSMTLPNRSARERQHRWTKEQARAALYRA